MAVVSVRPARPGDAAEIARIQLTTWRAAYAGVLPARILDGLTAGDVEEQWSAAVLRPPSPGHRVLVAMEQEWLVGFAALEPAEDDGLDPTSTAMISTLLVEPRWGRRGHGSRLLAACVDLLRENRYATAVTWVLDSDPAVRTFYSSAGWAPDGATRALDMDGRLVSEIRLHASLPTEPPAG